MLAGTARDVFMSEVALGRIRSPHSTTLVFLTETFPAPFDRLSIDGLGPTFLSRIGSNTRIASGSIGKEIPRRFLPFGIDSSSTTAITTVVRPPFINRLSMNASFEGRIAVISEIGSPGICMFLIDLTSTNEDSIPDRSRRNLEPNEAGPTLKNFIEVGMGSGLHDF